MNKRNIDRNGNRLPQISLTGRKMTTPAGVGELVKFEVDKWTLQQTFHVSVGGVVTAYPAGTEGVRWAQ